MGGKQLREMERIGYKNILKTRQREFHFPAMVMVMVMVRPVHPHSNYFFNSIFLNSYRKIV